MKINQIRKDILQKTKSYVVKNGWSDDLFNKTVKSSKYTAEEVTALFPEGHKALLQIYLDEINDEMTKAAKISALTKLRVHKKIREIIILRLKVMQKEKKLISRTFMYLLLPKNKNIAFRNLYKMVDQVWFLAGDNSTDYNFYSKRIILASVYIQTMIHFVNNENIDETILVLDKKLKRVSKIPKFKEKANNIIKFIPKVLKLGKTLSIFKQ